MQVSGGRGSVEINGKVQFENAVAPARSEINRHFVFSTIGLNGVPGKEATLDNFKIWAGPKSVARLPLRPNTPDENRQATRHAADFIDPSNPAPGIQQAIDSLPPAGGQVILPAGEFLMRRHLRLRNHVTLRGQGAGKTILKAVQGERCPILEMKSSSGLCVITVAPKDAQKFKVGDGVCFDDNWGHPGYLDSVNKDCVVAALSETQITISGVAPGALPYRPVPSLPGSPTAIAAKELRHWFPQIYAHCTESVELKDLTIVGGEGGWGGFQSSAVTLGQVAGARVSRVQITKWEGDGFSLQTGGDTMVTDNTVSNVQQGYHPGTITQRFLWTRNLGVGNRSCGLYFCWFNRNGVYHRNTLDRFDGYGWPSDVFNLIDRNACVSTSDFAIEQGEGGGGVVFNNRFPQIRVGHGYKGAPTFDFVVAQNRADSLRFVEGDVERNLFAGNLTSDGSRPTAVPATRGNNLFSDQGAGLDLRRFPAGIERTVPAEPPVLPQPVLDGAGFYRPEKPDAGFQEALDQLAAGGGTLLLPAGRFGLSQPLTVPSGVTLSGCGLGTVLHAAKREQTGSIIVVNKASQVTVRDLVILGEYERQTFRAPAIAFQDVQQGELFAVDVCGWEGSAFKIAGGSMQVRDCRALGCASNGFEFAQCQVNCIGNIARECAHGFVVGKCPADSLLEANISGGNRGDGYQIDHCTGALVYANNAHFNNRDGITASNTENASFVANMLDNNNQSSAEGCGIRLAGSTRGCRLHYNNFQDEQMQPTQTRAIVEDASAGNNLIRFNLSRTRLHAGGQGSTVSDNFGQ
jgi:hypothetical protein